MKRVFKYLLLCLIVLIPFSVNAIKTSSIKFDDVKDGYYCTLLISDESASQYDVFYTYRDYGAMTYYVGDAASNRPNPKCLDSTYSEKELYLTGSNCYFNLYATKTNTSEDEYSELIYNDWSSSITDSNKYVSNIKDCIATAILTDGRCSADNCKGYDKAIYVEAKTNSEFYTDDEMATMKQNDYTFGDDTEFCFASTVRTEAGSSEKVYFGHPIFYIDYYGAYNTLDNKEDLSLISGQDSNDKYIISFDGVKTTTSTNTGDSRHCNVYEDGKICIDGFPYANDEWVTFDTLANMNDEEKKWKSFILTDGKGLITDSETCIALAKEAGIDSTPVDNTLVDPDRPITETEFADLLIQKGISKKTAIKSCYNGDSKDGQYHCYRYTFLPSIHPMYNTTVWTKKIIGCGFELADDWDWSNCKMATLSVTYEQCKSAKTTNSEGKIVYSDPYCRNIAHSGFNATADFYDERPTTERNIACENFMSIHIIYRFATILAPIITILFVTFDLVSSIISGDPKKVAKFRSRLLRRIIALILLIIIPIFIHILVNTLSKNSYLKDTSLMKCVILGNGTDIHKDVDKTIDLKKKDK